MAQALTAFSPPDNGFRFVNRFELDLPVKFTLPLVGPLDLSQVVFGLCGGMCFSALDYFYRGESLPLANDPEQIDARLLVYLCERQLDSLSIPVLLKVLEWMLIEDEEVAGRMGRYEIPKLRRQLDQGKPAVLGLIRARGWENPTRNHQVLATGYTLDESSGHLSIQLYDPNHPGQTVSLELKPAPAGSRTRPPGWITQSTGEELRGFFVIPYKRQKLLPVAGDALEAARPGTLGLTEERTAGLRMGTAAEAHFQLRWPVDSRRVTQGFGENPSMYKGFGLPGHEGLDLFAPSGANIYAAADGEVYQAGHPDGHAYGLQIRIRHEHGGKVYHTVYAHLSKVFVSVGQKVRAGERIALADNTGNSFGSHLHLTLKIDGAQTPGYPRGIVDPLPYLAATDGRDEPAPEPEEPKDLPPPSGLKVFTGGQVNLRTRPDLNAPVLALLASGEALEALGTAAEVNAKLGRENQWLPVRTAAGKGGYVAAWLVQGENQSFPPSDLVVYTSDLVNLRSGPGTGFGLVATLPVQAPLTVLGDAQLARQRVGRQGEWIQVQTEEGKRGFVAAWLVHLTGATPKPSGLVVTTAQVVNLRARPTTEANVLAMIAPGDPLTVLGDPALAQASIGQMDRWLNVSTGVKISGYVAAWLVQPVSGGSGGGQDFPALTVFPTADINLRAQPSLNSPRVNGAFRGEPLKVLEDDLTAARKKLGVEGAWVYTEKSDGARGWAAAWLVSTVRP